MLAATLASMVQVVVVVVAAQIQLAGPLLVELVGTVPAASLWW